MKKVVLSLAVVVMFVSTAFGTVYTGNYFKLTDAAGVDLSGKSVAVAMGDKLAVSIWAQVPSQATISSSKFVLAYDTAAAIKDGNLSVTLPGDFQLNSTMSGFTYLVTGPSLVNGMSATSANGYGCYYSASMPSGTFANWAGEWTKIATVSIKNVNLGVGQSHQVTLFDKAASVAGNDTVIVANADSYSQLAGSPASFMITGVPEPISMILLAIGGLFISRRK